MSTPENNPLLSVEGLTVSYGGKDPVVQDVSFAVEAGQITAIVGESGSGKTTSAMASIGLLDPSAHIHSGTIRFKGEDITGATNAQWRQLRGVHIGLVPQDPNNSLNPLKTIGASVEDGMAIHGIGDAASRKERTLALLQRVGIDDPERRYAQYPHELSGGMKQRVLIAAAVALEPQVIIADEPTSALDVTVQKTILDLLDEMRAELGLGIVLITHDLAVAGDRADDVVIMQRGRVVERGPAGEVLANPTQEYSRRLLDNAPSLAVADAYHRPATSTETLLSVEGLSKQFGDFTAIENISFEVKRGSTHALVGGSGSGKTTTGRAIAMFNQPTAGTITLDGTDLTQLTPREKRAMRARVQMVYQNPYASLDPKMRIRDIVAEPVRNLHGVSKSKSLKLAEEYLDRVALDPSVFAQRMPAQLSGGQRQRVAIARALIVQPELVVLDEAVSALDVTVQAQILELLEQLQRELGLTYVFISHDLAVVRQISDTVSVFHRGRQVETGPTDTVFTHPRHEVTRELIDAIPGSVFRARQLGEFVV
ncbi:ABC transporter ATP-binding protein [Corynebacterium sp. HMSC30G07]|uniref:dipeptide ABC transporter ATP-binding protein n=1 Tax=Corynebacterium sp. HMSC30G07 TaxID=1581072 RepID=UPI0008A31127|nr:ABC transporter ATP-binding protein [Corynebacterium sp. HMSC30G07]OFT77446.1 ABC transporter ATP-binding protein [Corynebacterium sp. HMSC30G07]